MNNIIRSIFTSIAALLAFTTPAFAEGGAPASGFTQLVPLILIMLVFWFLLIRPQQNRAKEHRSLIESLKKGDKVITNAGIFGSVTDVKDNYLNIEIADGVRIKIQRDAVAALSD